MSFVSRNKIVISLFLIAIGSGFFWNQKVFSQPISNDQSFYDEVSRNLAANGQFTYKGLNAATEPIYPLFLAGIYKFFGHSFNLVRIVQIILFGISSILVFFIIKSLLTRNIAVISTLMMSLFWGLATLAGVLIPASLLVFLSVLFIFALSKINECSSVWLFVTSGILLGFITLTVGAFQFLFILIFINFLILFWKKSKSLAISRSLIFLIGFLLVILSWFKIGGGLSNGTIVPKSGYMLISKLEVADQVSRNYTGHLIGNLLGYYIAEKFYPNINPSDSHEASESERKYSEMLKNGLNYFEIDESFSNEARSKIIAEPQRYAFGVLLNFVNLNGPHVPRSQDWQTHVNMNPMFAEKRHSNIPDAIKTLIIIGIRSLWFSFIFLVIYGFLDLKKTIPTRELRNKFRWIFIFILYVNFIYSLIHGIPRYALSVYPFYFMIAVIGFSSLWNKKKHYFYGQQLG